MAVLKRKSEGWSPFRDIMEFRDEMDRLFDSFFSPWPLRKGKAGKEIVWSPQVDVYEDENDVIVEAELPGLKGDEVDINITGNVVTLRGEKKEEKEEKGKSYHILERSYGSFERAIDLPVDVEPSKAKATMKDGVLKVVLPKIAKAKPKKIPVEVK